MGSCITYGSICIYFYIHMVQDTNTYVNRQFRPGEACGPAFREAAKTSVDLDRFAPTLVQQAQL